jgi:hypothetical protein
MTTNVINKNISLKSSVADGCLGVLKYLPEKSTDIINLNDYVVWYTSIYGHLNVVKYFVEHL